jgi:hypothetical protein
MSSQTAPEVLDVAAVMARYGLNDRRSARRAMDAAGAFLIGGRLLVRAADPVAYEDRLRDERRGLSNPAPAGTRLGPGPRPRLRRSVRDRSVATTPPASPDWWRAIPAEPAARPASASPRSVCR